MENKTIEALEKLVTLKDETIKELERQIQLLKNQPPVVVPQFPLQPYQPAQPISLPYIQTPNPLYPPYIVTSDGTSRSITITGDPLPLGSVQMGSNQQITNPNITYTLTNADGSANIINLKECSRA